jgi:hypothetical protein
MERKSKSLAFKRGKPGFMFLRSWPLGVLILAVGLFIPRQVLAKPTITWTPSQISETVSPNESKSITVSFTSSKNINNIAVWVVPELQPYLRIQPIVLSLIKAGTPFAVTLIFTPAADAPFGTFDGTIQLKSTGKSAETFAKPLPITVNIWQSLEDPSLSYWLQYPGNWTATIGNNNAVDIVGQVTSSIPTAPGDMAGICKVSVTSHDNSDLLPLSDWLQQAEIETGAPPPISSVPITIDGVTGIKEVIEEIGLTTTVYLSKGDRILSFELLCGDDAMCEGEATFSKILTQSVLSEGDSGEDDSY